MSTKIKKDRSDQHSPRCPDHFGPSVSKLDSTLGKTSAKANFRSGPTLTVDTRLKKVIESLGCAKQLTDFVIDLYSFCYSVIKRLSHPLSTRLLPSKLIQLPLWIPAPPREFVPRYGITNFDERSFFTL